MAEEPLDVKYGMNFRMQDLRGKVAIVTGATKGIGRAITLDLATRGASILGTYSSPLSSPFFTTLQSLIADSYYTSNLPCPPIIGIPADIAVPSISVPAILSALSKHFAGKLDILVFNAAAMGLARMGEGNVDEGFLETMLGANLKFPVLLMEGLVREGGFRAGSRVVAVSSEGVRARRPWGGSVYAATKAGIETLMRLWADELGKRPGMEGTTFNSVSVGFTKTDAFNRIPEEVRSRLEAADAAEVAVGNRIGEPEDVADVVGLLVSEKARWISGSVVDATGGKSKIF